MRTLSTLSTCNFEKRKKKAPPSRIQTSIADLQRQTIYCMGGYIHVGRGGRFCVYEIHSRRIAIRW